MSLSSSGFYPPNHYDEDSDVDHQDGGNSNVESQEPLPLQDDLKEPRTIWRNIRPPTQGAGGHEDHQPLLGEVYGTPHYDQASGFSSWYSNRLLYGFSESLDGSRVLGGPEATTVMDHTTWNQSKHQDPHNHHPHHHPVDDPKHDLESQEEVDADAVRQPFVPPPGPPSQQRSSSRRVSDMSNSGRAPSNNLSVPPFRYADKSLDLSQSTRMGTTSNDQAPLSVRTTTITPHHHHHHQEYFDCFDDLYAAANDAILFPSNIHPVPPWSGSGPDTTSRVSAGSESQMGIKECDIASSDGPQHQQEEEEDHHPHHHQLVRQGQSSYPIMQPWSHDIHRDFVRAVFEVGMTNCSPAVIAEHMVLQKLDNKGTTLDSSNSSKSRESPTIGRKRRTKGGKYHDNTIKGTGHHQLEQQEKQKQELEHMTSEKIKSHLQKFRQQKKRELEIFLNDHDKALSWAQQRSAEDGHYYGHLHSSATTVDAADSEASQKKKMKITNIPPPIPLGGYAAGLVTWSIIRNQEEERLNQDRQGAASADATIDPTPPFLRRHDAPDLTEDEIETPLGKCLVLTKQLIEQYHQVILVQRKTVINHSKDCNDVTSESPKMIGSDDVIAGNPLPQAPSLPHADDFQDFINQEANGSFGSRTSEMSSNNHSQDLMIQHDVPLSAQDGTAAFDCRVSFTQATTGTPQLHAQQNPASGVIPKVSPGPPFVKPKSFSPDPSGTNVIQTASEYRKASPGGPANHVQLNDDSEAFRRTPDARMLKAYDEGNNPVNSSNHPSLPLEPLFLEYKINPKGARKLQPRSSKHHQGWIHENVSQNAMQLPPSTPFTTSDRSGDDISSHSSRQVLRRYLGVGESQTPFANKGSDIGVHSEPASFATRDGVSDEHDVIERGNMVGPKAYPIAMTNDDMDQNRIGGPEAQKLGIHSFLPCPSRLQQLRLRRRKIPS